jgi:hypothetical protein
MTMHDDGDHASERLDLRALDPDRDPSAQQRFHGAVMSRLTGRGAPPAVPADPLFGLGSLPRPILIAASLATLAVLGVAGNARRARAQAPATIAEATGVPRAYLATGASRP